MNNILKRILLDTNIIFYAVFGAMYRQLDEQYPYEQKSFFLFKEFIAKNHIGICAVKVFQEIQKNRVKVIKERMPSKLRATAQEYIDYYLKILEMPDGLTLTQVKKHYEQITPYIERIKPHYEPITKTSDAIVRYAYQNNTTIGIGHKNRKLQKQNICKFIDSLKDNDDYDNIKKKRQKWLTKEIKESHINPEIGNDKNLLALIQDTEFVASIINSRGYKDPSGDEIILAEGIHYAQNLTKEQHPLIIASVDHFFVLQSRTIKEAYGIITKKPDLILQELNQDHV